jgi:hypothetical protein
LVLNIFLRALSLFIRTKCPAHASPITVHTHQVPCPC